MFCWGVITIGMAGVTSFATLTVVRFLLGVFEAGESAHYVVVSGNTDILPRPLSWSCLLCYLLVQT